MGDADDIVPDWIGDFDLNVHLDIPCTAEEIEEEVTSDQDSNGQED